MPTCHFLSLITLEGFQYHTYGCCLPAIVIRGIKDIFFLSLFENNRQTLGSDGLTNTSNPIQHALHIDPNERVFIGFHLIVILIRLVSISFVHVFLLPALLFPV